MAKKLIGKSANGFEVYVIVDDEHMLAHKNVTESLISEAVSMVDYNPTYWIGEVEMGRVIGLDGCVETHPGDDVRMETRPGRKLPSRVVYNRLPVPTTILTVGICTDPDDGIVTVFTAFPGKLSPKEPSDPRLKDEERPEAEAFWASHALVADGQ